jgi:acyl carrier protein
MPLTDEVVKIVGDVLRLPPAGRALLADTAATHTIPEWTSAKHVEIIVAIEDRWDLEVPEQELVRLTTIPRIVEFLAANGKE